MTKPFDIPKCQVMQAYKLVKANAGSAGIDHQSIAHFEENLKDNLYRIWNRMSSGTYLPPPVKAVSIPKKSGGVRVLGVPTVSDRIAQMVVKLQIEPMLEPHFLPDSYGYRPRKSAIDAISITRRRCWKQDWVLEFDIKGLFDNIPHDLLLKAVRKHVDCRWALLCIERWLTVPLKKEHGALESRTKGTPQGGVVSPILSNLFLHYVFDAWISKHYPDIRWCRYADDGLLHCQSLQQAQTMLGILRDRFLQCGLELHPEKTKIVYCRDSNRQGVFPVCSFDFLGYTFRGRTVKSREGIIFRSFSPAVCKSAIKSMNRIIRESNVRNRVDLNIEDIARWFNPKLQGWINYYGRFNRSALSPVLKGFNRTLRKWMMCKFSRLRGHKIRSSAALGRIFESNPTLFVHWRLSSVGAFADRGRRT